MANTPYVDDRFLYNPEKGIVWFNGVELPATKDLMEHAKMQLEHARFLDSWIALANDDINKTTCLYALLDQKLFYDKLSNYDKKRLAEALSLMSSDVKNFETENIDYFNSFSSFIIDNIENTQSFIEKERDIAFNDMVEEFYYFNIQKFRVTEPLKK